MAVLILGRAGESILVADNVQGPFIEKSHVTERVTPLWYRCVDSAFDRKALVIDSALVRLKECRGSSSGAGSFGYEQASCPAALLDGLRAADAPRLTPIDAIVHQLRRRKDADEIALLRRAMQAAEAGHAAGLAGIRTGMSELAAYLLVQEAACQAAGEQAIVYGDFASGPRSMTGGSPTLRTIEPGDLVLLDFSVVLGGYRGDFANTFVCGGKATPRQRELYDACLEAMVAGEALLRAGVSCRVVDAAVRGFFEKRKLGASFPHHSGHGIGLGHPEAPFLVPESSETLLAGDVVTLEPGQYVHGVGGMRFERNYLVTESGYELLSHHKLTIDAVVAGL